jgi:FkbM family methyltransferase
VGLDAPRAVFRRLTGRAGAAASPSGRVRVLSPAGVEDRGFGGKNILADQVELAGEALVIVDVGAYDGAITADYLELFPRAVCHAVEPHPDSFRTLTERLSANPRARVYRAALADAPGTRALYSFPTPATNSLLAPVANVADVVGTGHMDTFLTEEVEVMTLDSFAAQEGLEHIDVLKLDVQGAEGLVIEGAEGLLRRRAIGLIATEVNFVSVYRCQALYHDVATTLGKHGYRLYDFYNFHYATGEGQVQWGDAIFLPQGHDGVGRSRR